MNTRRKLSALLFALALCFIFALPVHAAETSDTGAVTSAVQSLNAETSDDDTQPSTGDTTIFYVAGGALMVGGIVLLITRKRMNQ